MFKRKGKTWILEKSFEHDYSFLKSFFSGQEVLHGCYSRLHGILFVVGDMLGYGFSAGEEIKKKL